MAGENFNAWVIITNRTANLGATCIWNIFGRFIQSCSQIHLLFKGLLAEIVHFGPRTHIALRVCWRVKCSNIIWLQIWIFWQIFPAPRGTRQLGLIRGWWTPISVHPKYSWKPAIHPPRMERLQWRLPPHEYILTPGRLECCESTPGDFSRQFFFAWRTWMEVLTLWWCISTEADTKILLISSIQGISWPGKGLWL